MLLAGAVTAAVPPAAAVAGGVHGLLPDELGNVLVRALLVASQIEKFVAQTDQRFPAVFVQGFQLRYVLYDDRTKNTAAAHRSQRRQKAVLGQRDVRELIHQAMDGHRQPPLVDAVGLTVERLDELGVHHADQIVEALVRIGDAAEQCHFFLAHLVQVKFIHHRQPVDLRQVEGRQPHADAHQNRLCSFTRNELSRTF